MLYKIYKYRLVCIFIKLWVSRIIIYFKNSKITIVKYFQTLKLMIQQNIDNNIFKNNYRYNIHSQLDFKEPEATLSAPTSYQMMSNNSTTLEIWQ